MFVSIVFFLRKYIVLNERSYIVSLGSTLSERESTRMAVPFRLANASLVERVARFAEISWTDEGSGRELLARLALPPRPTFALRSSLE